MTGLEKIIECIGAEARERARALLQSTEEECRRMASETAARCENTRARMREQTLRDGEALIEQTREAVEREREEKLAAVREAALDRVFAGVRAELCSTDYGKYREFLSAWLVCALLEQHRAEQEALERGESVSRFLPLEVAMNESDRSKFGRAVLESARKTAERRIGKEKAARLSFCEEHAEIDGGVILYYGAKRYDYSLEKLLSDMRAEMRDSLLEMLFA